MKKLSKILMIIYLLFSPFGVVYADDKIDNNTRTESNKDTTNNQENKNIDVGKDTSELGKASKENVANPTNTPKITHVEITGDVDNTKTGIDFYNNITISLIGDNLTDKHFLTKEGLYWSEKTYVELIKGEELGILNDASTFGAQNTPTKEVKAFSTNKGDSGRINFVGKTKSNEDLDLIWIVTESDQEEWKANSGYSNNNRIKGLGFSGEQFIPKATGNSIVVLYNNSSNLGLHYKIVKHGTNEEMPVILSFISTDIDAAQGVQTDLANIAEIIPKESNLVKKDGIIYDATPGVVGLNGSVDLPKGGYLGAGFLSNFNYIFYSPAPERVKDSYNYPIAVRYDIFGSSLQAKLLTRLQQHIKIDYVDEQGNKLKDSEQYLGYHDQRYNFQSINIPKHKLIDIKKDETNSNYPTVKFIYQPTYTVTLKFIDEQGKEISKEQTYSVDKNYNLSYIAPEIKDYITPETLKKVVNKDITHTFVYKNKPKPSVPDKKEENKETNNKKPEVEKEKPVDNKKPEVEKEKPVDNKKPEVEKEKSSDNKKPDVEKEKPSDNKKPEAGKPNKESGQNNNNKNTEITTTKPNANNKVPNIIVPNVSSRVDYIRPKENNSVTYRPALNVNNFVNTLPNNSYYYNNQRQQPSETKLHAPTKKVEAEKKDPFLINTGMNKEEKQQFLNYIKEVARLSREKNGNDQNKINHDISNAIAYSTYSKDFSQKLTNDFGEEPGNLTESIKKLFYNIHKYEKYRIDFPHLAAPLATSEESVQWKEIIKGLAGSSPVNLVVKNKDVLFQLNSFTGDLLTYLDEKDGRTDVDAYILKYHPQFKDRSLEQRIEKYYSINNLEVKRHEYYYEALKDKREQSGNKYYEIYLFLGSIMSAGALGLILKNKWDKFKEDYIDNFSTKISIKVASFGLPILERLGYFDKYKNNNTSALKNLFDSLKPVNSEGFNKNNLILGRVIVKEIAKVVNAIKEKVIEPIKKRAKLVYNKVLKPSYNKVATVVKNNLIKPISNKVLKPVYNKVIKPIYNKVVKSIYNKVLRKGYNKVAKPIYNSVLRPVYNKVAQPVINYLKNKVSKVGNFIKGFFGRR